MVSAVAASSAYSGVAQTRLVVAPAVQPAAAAPRAGVAVSISAMARSIAASAAAPSSIYQAISDYNAAQAAGTLSSFGAVTISDNSAGLTNATLTALATMLHNGKIANISLAVSRI